MADTWEALTKGVFPGARLVQDGTHWYVEVRGMPISTLQRNPAAAWARAAERARQELKNRKEQSDGK